MFPLHQSRRPKKPKQSKGGPRKLRYGGKKKKKSCSVQVKKITLTAIVFELFKKFAAERRFWEIRRDDPDKDNLMITAPVLGVESDNIRLLFRGSVDGGYKVSTSLQYRLPRCISFITLSTFVVRMSRIEDLCDTGSYENLEWSLGGKIGSKVEDCPSLLVMETEVRLRTAFQSCLRRSSDGRRLDSAEYVSLCKAPDYLSLLG